MKTKQSKIVAHNKKSPLPTGQSTTLDHELKFSFKYYDETNSKRYCLSKFTNDQVRSSLERLREVNGKTINELRQQRNFYHFHPVDWNSTTEKSGFRNRDLKELEPFQFSLANVNQQKTRVYGAMADNTFYIVWFDLNHKIWPSFKKNT